MAADASAYHVLGLEPGADSVAIADAYRRLIKQFHPDRDGGDLRRAAEINRAYRELRLAGRAREPLDLQFDDEADRRRFFGRSTLLFLAGLLLAVTAAAFALQRGGQVPLEAARKLAGVDRRDRIDEPIDWGEVRRGITEALRISKGGDEVALADASRQCHRALRADPNTARLDYCAAFDDAVIQLQDRDPLRDRGPFSEIAVTGRLMSGATMLSSDYLAIDTRLDRIRLQVELALAVSAPPPQIPAAGNGDYRSPAAPNVPAADDDAAALPSG